jgi:hypothetical protein
VERELPNPDRDHLSVMAALVLLSYALTRLVVLPSISTEVALLGLLVRFEIDTQFVMLTLAAALTSAGAAWLMQSHPQAKAQQSTFEHWVMPGLAALGLGSILGRVPLGLGLGIGLALAAGLLIAVLVAEYIVFDPTDPRYNLAALGLHILAYLLIFGAYFAVHAVGMRAIYSLPIVMAFSSAVAWRLLRLGLPGVRVWPDALLIGFVTAQLAWGLHYWPVSAIQQAMILGLATYLGEGFIVAHRGGGITKAKALEFAILAGISLIFTAIAS